jgi:hypothetical protein
MVRGKTIRANTRRRNTQRGGNFFNRLPDYAGLGHARQHGAPGGANSVAWDAWSQLQGNAGIAAGAAQDAAHLAAIGVDDAAHGLNAGGEYEGMALFNPRRWGKYMWILIVVFFIVYVVPCAIKGIWQLRLGPGEEAESTWLWGPFGPWFEKKKEGVDTFTCTAKASQDGTTVTKSCVASHFDPIKAALKDPPQVLQTEAQCKASCSGNMYKGCKTGQRKIGSESHCDFCRSGYKRVQKDTDKSGNVINTCEKCQPGYTTTLDTTDDDSKDLARVSTDGQDAGNSVEGTCEKINPLNTGIEPSAGGCHINKILRGISLPQGTSDMYTKPDRNYIGKDQLSCPIGKAHHMVNSHLEFTCENTNWTKPNGTSVGYKAGANGPDKNKPYMKWSPKPDSRNRIRCLETDYHHFKEYDKGACFQYGWGNKDAYALHRMDPITGKNQPAKCPPGSKADPKKIGNSEALCCVKQTDDISGDDDHSNCGQWATDLKKKNPKMKPCGMGKLNNTASLSSGTILDNSTKGKDGIKAAAEECCTPPSCTKFWGDNGDTICGKQDGKLVKKPGAAVSVTTLEHYVQGDSNNGQWTDYYADATSKCCEKKTKRESDAVSTNTCELNQTNGVFNCGKAGLKLSKKAQGGKLRKGKTIQECCDCKTDAGLWTTMNWADHGIVLKNSGAGIDKNLGTDSDGYIVAPKTVFKNRKACTGCPTDWDKAADKNKQPHNITCQKSSAVGVNSGWVIDYDGATKSQPFEGFANQGSGSGSMGPMAANSMNSRAFLA